MTAPTGRTVEELARSTHLPPDALLELLREDVARGLLVEAHGRFRLSAQAERRFGRALREIAPTRPSRTDRRNDGSAT